MLSRRKGHLQTMACTHTTRWRQRADARTPHHPFKEVLVPFEREADVEQGNQTLGPEIPGAQLPMTMKTHVSAHAHVVIRHPEP